jgi:hypothetical protein
MHRLIARYAAALGAALVLAVAACRDKTAYECLESNAQRYAFHLPGDTTAVFHWPASRMPIRLYAEPVGALPANTDSGAALWANAMRCGELAFVRVTDSTAADIIVRNPATLPPLPLYGVSAGADSVGACLGRTDGLLDSANRLVEPLRSYVAPNSGDAAAVEACYHFTVAHELGHAIGLFSHSTNVADLMHAVPRRRALSINDRFTVQLLYMTTPTIAPPPQ